MAEKKIDGVTYATSPLPAKRATVLWARITKVLGPSLPHLFRAFASRGDEQAASQAGLEALASLAATLDPEAFGDLVQEIVEIAEVQDNGKYRAVIYDIDFTGNLAGVLPVVGFVLQEQFGDFFSALAATGRQRKAVAG